MIGRIAVSATDTVFVVLQKSVLVTVYANIEKI